VYQWSCPARTSKQKRKMKTKKKTPSPTSTHSHGPNLQLQTQVLVRTGLRQFLPNGSLYPSLSIEDQAITLGCPLRLQIYMCQVTPTHTCPRSSYDIQGGGGVSLLPRCATQASYSESYSRASKRSSTIPRGYRTVLQGQHVRVLWTEWGTSAQTERSSAWEN